MYKALVSFSGLISMAKGEVREISNLAIAKDLLRAGYIEEVKTEKTVAKPKAVEKTEPKPRKKRTPKGG